MKSPNLWITLVAFVRLCDYHYFIGLLGRVSIDSLSSVHFARFSSHRFLVENRLLHSTGWLNSRSEFLSLQHVSWPLVAIGIKRPQSGFTVCTRPLFGKMGSHPRLRSNRYLPGTFQRRTVTDILWDCSIWLRINADWITIPPQPLPADYFCLGH